MLKLNSRAAVVMVAAGVLLFGTFSLSSCTDSRQSEVSENEISEQNETNAYYTFKDSTGKTVSLEKKPEKVAVLFSSYADMWVDAGGDIFVTVGETVERGFADEEVKLVDSGAGKTIDEELLISYEPDFVICSADIEAQLKASELLDSAQIPSAAFIVESFEDYAGVMKILTDITQNKAAYEKYCVEQAEQIEDIKKQRAEVVENTANIPKILFIRAGSSSSSTKAKNADNNFVCKMLSELSTVNIADTAEILLDGLSFEEILVADPDYIFISTMGDEQAAKDNIQSLFAQDNWSQLTAVKNNMYTFLPKDMFQFKPNSRWANSYQYLTDILNEIG